MAQFSEAAPGANSLVNRGFAAAFSFSSPQARFDRISSDDSASLGFGDLLCDASCGLLRSSDSESGRHARRRYDGRLVPGRGFEHGWVAVHGRQERARRRNLQSRGYARHHCIVRRGGRKTSGTGKDSDEQHGSGLREHRTGPRFHGCASVIHCGQRGFCFGYLSSVQQRHCRNRQLASGECGDQHSREGVGVVVTRPSGT